LLDRLIDPLIRPRSLILATRILLITHRFPAIRPPGKGERYLVLVVKILPVWWMEFDPF
jgi:hypothetical protein